MKRKSSKSDGTAARRREAAERLRAAHDNGQPCRPVRDLIEADDIASAYAVQDSNTRLWIRQGRRLVGRKIGLTSHAVQKQLGVDQPDFGMLFADMAVCDGEPVQAGRVLQAKVEAEIAFVLERDIKIEQPTMADVMRCDGDEPGRRSGFHRRRACLSGPSAQRHTVARQKNGRGRASAAERRHRIVRGSGADGHGAARCGI
jgi:hypothetical protein